MPGVTIPDGHGEAKFSYSLTGRRLPVSFTLGVRGVGSPPNWDVIAHDMFHDFTTGVDAPGAGGPMSEAYTFNGVEITYNEGGIMFGAVSDQAAIPGESSGIQPPPANCAVLVRKKTVFLGKKYQGRMYMPPTWCTEASIDPMGVISPTNMSYFVLSIGTWKANMDAATTYEPSLLHHGATAPTLITSLVPQQTIATQRRRLR